MAKTDKRFLINMIVIVVLGALSGLFMGNYYVKNFMGGVTADFLPTEAAIRDDVGAVVARCSGKSVTSLSATDNFIMAEYKLSTRDYVHKSTKGTVTAAGVSQKLVSDKAYVAGEYFGEEISSGVVKLATKYYWVKEAEKVTTYEGSVSGLSANYSGAAAQTKTLDAYNSEMGVKADQFINYIVSSKTVKSQKYNGLVNGHHSFTIELDPVLTAKNYMYKVKKTSGSNEYPSFEKISFDFEIGEDWTIYSMHCRETYKVAIKLLGRVTTTGDMTDTFSYDDNFVIPR